MILNFFWQIESHPRNALRYCLINDAQFSISAPPAHQSPKPSRAGSSGSGVGGGASGSGGVGGVGGGGGGGTVRQANEPLMFVSPKRQKYAAATAAAMSPQSILR